MFRAACSIPYYDSVFLTGGWDTYDYYTLDLVQQYDLNGLVPYPIPSLNEARESHGCGYYYNKDGEKVEFKHCSSFYRAVSSGLARCWRIQLRLLLLLL